MHIQSKQHSKRYTSNIGFWYITVMKYAVNSAFEITVNELEKKVDCLKTEP